MQRRLVRDGQHQSEDGYAGSKGFYNARADKIKGMEDPGINYPGKVPSNIYEAMQYLMTSFILTSEFFESYNSNDSIIEYDWGYDRTLKKDSTLRHHNYPFGYMILTPDTTFFIDDPYGN